MYFLGMYGVENIVLGCTEFPVLLGHINMVSRYKFYDLLTYAIQEIHVKLS